MERRSDLILKVLFESGLLLRPDLDLRASLPVFLALLARRGRGVYRSIVTEGRIRIKKILGIQLNALHRVKVCRFWWGHRQDSGRGRCDRTRKKLPSGAEARESTQLTSALKHRPP